MLFKKVAHKPEFNAAERPFRDFADKYAVATGVSVSYYAALRNSPPWNRDMSSLAYAYSSIVQFLKPED